MIINYILCLVIFAVQSSNILYSHQSIRPSIVKDQSVFSTFIVDEIF